jgi:arylsulfatase A-like enzyme
MDTPLNRRDCLALPALPLLAKQKPRGRRRTAARPDIVLIVTDDMRADDWAVLPLTQQAHHWTVLPNLVYPTPLCSPSRATLLTGQYAHNHGVTGNGQPLKAIQDVLPVALRRRGYHTVGVGKLDTHPATGWDVPPLMRAEAPFPPADTVRDHALTEIAATPNDKPLFLWLGFHEPHKPYSPAPRHADADVGPVINDEDRQRKRELLAVDDAVAAIADALGSRWDSAAVVVLSDHGYLRGEHGTRAKSIWWDQVTRVTARIAIPSLAPGTDDRLVGTIDIAPTLLATAGAKPWWTMDGRPLQDRWQRKAVLLESWALESDGEARLPFDGLKGMDWCYVEPEGAPSAYYRLDDAETNDHIELLSAAELRRLHRKLAAAGACRDGECP